MRIDVGLSDLKAVLDTAKTSVARDVTAAMRETTPLTKQELREQMVSAGLGSRLANTWRGETYPSGKVSLNPAGYVWSNAPDIVDSFVRGATIRPVNGGRWLWIPTKNVPGRRRRQSRSGRSLRGGAMTPEEVEDTFNTDFDIRKGRAGTLLAYIDVVKAFNVRGGLRANTRGRQRQGRKAEPVLMFVLRRSVTMPRLLDLDGPAQRWATRFEAAFTRRLGGS